MTPGTQSQPQRRAHIARFVFTVKCPGCRRWLVFRVTAAQASTFDTRTPALVYAKQLRGDSETGVTLPLINVHCPDHASVAAVAPPEPTAVRS